MIKKTTFDAIGGLDEEFQVALNDVDLCLKVRAHGELVVENPMVEMYHYESKSRGMEDSKEKHERFKREIARFRTKWADILEKGDPYYNPNLTAESVESTSILISSMRSKEGIDGRRYF